MLERTIPHPAFLPPPPAAVTRLLSQFDRRQLEGFIEVAIGLLDVAAGDTDLEDSETGSNMVDERGKFIGDCEQLHDDENREDDDHGEDDDPKERAWLEDSHATMNPPADWGRAWNASVGSEDDEDTHDREQVDDV